MKKINELLKEYLTAMEEVNPDRFQESYHGADPAYAKKVIKKLEHIFYEAYGNGKTGMAEREYLLAPTVLGSKRAGAAVLGVYLCEVDCEGRGENKGKASVLQIFVPDRYQRMSKLKDFLSWADHVNGGKIVYCSSERMPEQIQWTEAVSEPRRQMEPAMIQRR